MPSSSSVSDVATSAMLLLLLTLCLSNDRLFSPGNSVLVLALTPNNNVRTTSIKTTLASSSSSSSQSSSSCTNRRRIIDCQSQLSFRRRTADNTVFSRSATTTTSCSSTLLRLSARDDDFSSFASSLEGMEEPGDNNNPQNTQQGRTSRSTATATATRKTSTPTTTSSWKEDLDELLDFTTSASRRQTLLKKLLNSNQEIREAVQKALQERNIDPLLTPTGKKLQDGTRAVARQVTSDILPQLLADTVGSSTTSSSASSNSRNNNNNNDPSSFFLFPLKPPPGADLLLTRVGPQIFRLAQQQVQRSLEILQQDLADPMTRIPQRLSQQVKDVQNVLSETPKDLREPQYTVVWSTEDYEIRDYESYQVASTQIPVLVTTTSESEKQPSSSIGGIGMTTSTTTTTASTSTTTTSSSSSADWSETGAAFNALASYLYGNNAEKRIMDMTTPVTTTMTGEMRFYLADTNVPAPLNKNRNNNNELQQPQTSSTSVSSLSSSSPSYPEIEIQTLPPSRLAVRRFTGFATDGEIARQKQSLLTALELDGVELDVPHGQTVPHVVFQYNPPYTLPVIRRNEIAVPVVGPSEDVEANRMTPPWWNTQDPWEIRTNDDDDADGEDELLE